MVIHLQRKPGVQFGPFWDTHMCERHIFSFDRLYHACKLGIAVDVREILCRWHLSDRLHDMNWRWKDGSTPLLIATQRGHLAVVRSLLATYPTTCDASSPGSVYDALSDSMPLRRRSIRSIRSSVKSVPTNTVVALDPNCAWVNSDTKSYFGHTALMIACEDGREDIASALLSAKADVNITTRDKRLALHFAAANNHVSLVNVVMRKMLDSASDINAVDSYGRTPLHWAVQRGHVSVVECLLARSANVNPLTAPYPTPLFMALHQARTSIAEMLVEAKAAPYDPAFCNGTLHALEFCVLFGRETPNGLSAMCRKSVQKTSSRAENVLLSFCATFASEHNWAAVGALAEKVLRSKDGAQSAAAMEWAVRSYCAQGQIALAHHACALWGNTAPDGLHQLVYALSPYVYQYHSGLRVVAQDGGDFTVITTKDIEPNTTILAEVAAVPFCNHNVGEPEWVVEFLSQYFRPGTEPWRSWGKSESASYEVAADNVVATLEGLHPRSLAALPYDHVPLLKDIRGIVEGFDIDLSLSSLPDTMVQHDVAEKKAHLRKQALLTLARMSLNCHDDGIHLSEAFVNHSCIPNCEARGVHNVQLVTTRHVRAGSELRFSYLKRTVLEEPVDIRMGAFTALWGALCDCKRCAAEKMDSRAWESIYGMRQRESATEQWLLQRHLQTENECRGEDNRASTHLLELLELESLLSEHIFGPFSSKSDSVRELILKIEELMENDVPLGVGDVLERVKLVQSSIWR